MKNQCDGCQAGIPVVKGAHRMGKPGGYPDLMSCQASKYKEELTEEEKVTEQWRQLAYQFDRHRMSALALLKGVAEGKVTTEEVAEFLKLPPPPGKLPPVMEVWVGPMPESNGKSNFTAILRRKGGNFIMDPMFTIARSEYPDRVRYEADEVKYLLGLIDEKPCVIDYDTDLHSGYVKPQDA